VLTLVCTGLAVAVAYERDRLLVAMGIGFGFVAIATAAIVWVARPLAGSIFIGDSIGRGAFNDVYRTVASPLYRQEIVVAVLSVLLIVAGLVVGVIDRRRHPVDEWLEYETGYPPGQHYPPGYPAGQPVPPGRSW
jgi:hypothetical protein